MSTSFALFAQRQPDPAESAAAMVVMAIYVVLIIVMIVANWKLNEKAGEPGWACLVPIYNVIVLGRMAGLTTLWIVLLFVPCVNIIALFMLNIKLAERFGKDAGFGIAMAFLPFICMPILAFGSARYEPPHTAP